MRKRILSFLVLGIFVFLAFGSVPDENNRSSNSSGSTSSSRNKQNYADVPIANISWSEIDRIYNLNNKTTELQKKEAWNNYEGKKVKWSGSVSSVAETFGTLQLQVKMNSSTFTSDVIISLRSDQRQKALALSEGNNVTFSGILSDWGTLMPISLDDGELY